MGGSGAGAAQRKIVLILASYHDTELTQRKKLTRSRAGRVLGRHIRVTYGIPVMTGSLT